MKLPSVESCGHDQFLHTLRGDDERGFLSVKNRTNQAFLIKRRFNYSLDIMKKYLAPPSSNIVIGDFACGTGNVGLTLAEEGFSVEFVDNEVKFFDFIKMKHTKGDIRFREGDCSTFISDKKYSAVFFGEAIEHMANPLKTLQNLRENLVTGGILCITTPNGGFVNCYEKNWTEVKDQHERNEKLANNIGNHVCEFTQNELAELLRFAGFAILDQRLILSDQISRKSLLRRILPMKVLWHLDLKYSKTKNSNGKTWGRTQIITAQRVH